MTIAQDGNELLRLVTSWPNEHGEPGHGPVASQEILLGLNRYDG